MSEQRPNHVHVSSEVDSVRINEDEDGIIIILSDQFYPRASMHLSVEMARNLHWQLAGYVARDLPKKGSAT